MGLGKARRCRPSSWRASSGRVRRVLGRDAADCRNTPQGGGLAEFGEVATEESGWPPSGASLSSVDADRRGEFASQILAPLVVDGHESFVVDVNVVAGDGGWWWSSVVLLLCCGRGDASVRCFGCLCRSSTSFGAHRHPATGQQDVPVRPAEAQLAPVIGSESPSAGRTGRRAERGTCPGSGSTS